MCSLIIRTPAGLQQSTYQSSIGLIIHAIRACLIIICNQNPFLPNSLAQNES